MNSRIFIFALLLICIIFNTNSANKYVWLHGLNDDSNCWSIYQKAFTPTNAKKLYYDSESGIEQMSSDLWSNYSMQKWEPNNILIGHSMGGLIARELEYNHPGAIKGIITIGTPHQGASVMKELHNGGATNLTVKVANKALNSVQASVTAICYTIPGVGFVLPATINSGISGLYKYVGLPYFNGTINGIIARSYHTQCSVDMIPGSDYMKKIDDRKVNVPILTFACQEDRWQLARLGYCTSYNSDLQTNENANNDGNFDMGGYNQLKSVNGTFKTVGGVHAGISLACAVGGFWCPYFWAASAAHASASTKWYSTANYIDDGLDLDHAILLGSSHVERIKHRFLFIKWYDHVTVADPHDGVVSVSSQQLDKSKGTNVIWANTTIKGVNHMEEFNHKNTRKEFDDVLNGRSYAPLTFQNTNK